MKLKIKLIGSFLIIVLLTVVVGVIGIINTNKINSVVESVTKNWLPAVGYISQIDTSTSELRQYDLEYLNGADKAIIKQRMDATINEIKENIDKYDPTVTLAKEKENWDNFRKAYKEYLSQHENLVKLVNEGNVHEGLNIYTKTIDLQSNIKTPLIWLVNLNKEMGAKDAVTAAEVLKSGQITLIAILVVTIILATSIALIISRNITKSVSLVSNSLKRVADGDLTIEKLSIASKDELGEMATALNNMVENLRELISKVGDSSQKVEESSKGLSTSSSESSLVTEQIANTISQLAEGAITQATELQTTNSIFADIVSSIKAVSSNAENVYEASSKVSTISETGVIQSTNAVEKIESIENVSKETSSVIKALSDELKKVGEIITIIKGISDQTNLLALNAAIEAARAGEQGRGFAVVSDEVRKLAEQTSDSAEQIALLISTIQEKSTNAVNIINLSSKEVSEGVIAVNNAGALFKKIAVEISNINIQIKDVTLSVQDIENNSSKVVSSIQSVASIAEEFAASSEEVSAASEEQSASIHEVSRSAKDLDEMSAQLKDLVYKFKY